jgi:hypothetical protein
LISSADIPREGYYAADWVLLTADPEFLLREEIRQRAMPLLAWEPVLWTDRYASLWHVVVR